MEQVQAAVSEQAPASEQVQAAVSAQALASEQVQAVEPPAMKRPEVVREPVQARAQPA